MFTKKGQIKPFAGKVWLATPTMHGTEMRYVTEAYETNWMSTVGANINEVERIAAEKAEVKYAVALSCCTAALHLCVKCAGERLYGKPDIGHGAFEGKRVFCSDMTFAATLNPVVYEGGIPVFIDTERDTWNMDPVALEKAFQLYPEVKLVVVAHLYGFPGKIDEIREVCDKHGALIIEDAAESMGATYKGRQTGSYGDYAAISFNGNKMITGSSGGCLLTNDVEVAIKARKWSTQARENAAWYQHEEVGYNYRIVNRASYYIEILSLDEDKPAKPGEIGRIVVTDMYNKAMPFIRYDTGDLAIAGTVENGCCYTIKSLQGRTSDAVFAIDGTRVYSTSINNYICEFYDVRKYQLIQKGRGVFELLLVCKTDSPSVKAIEQNMRRLLGQSIDLKIKVVDDIADGKNGKFKTVVSEI